MNLIITILLIVLNILCIYAVFIEPHWIEITKHTITLSEDLKALAGTRIVHISDIHIRGQLGIYEKRITTIVNKQDPDIVCITGDLITREKDFNPAIDFIESFTPKDKTYCVLGNSDYYQAPHLASTLKDRSINAPVILLRNDIVTTQINSVPVTIAGIDDPMTDYADPGLFNDLKKYPGFKLALIHAYLDFPRVETGNADLILAGHTHGGQVLIMPSDVMLRWVRSAYKKKFKYLAGYHQEGNTWVNISRGLGVSALPIRFRSRPEITVFELISET